MQIALVIALSLHVLSTVFWAATSFALARTGGAGGEQLFRPQMAAAVIAVLTGGFFGDPVDAGTFRPTQQVLANCALAAPISASVHSGLRGRAVRKLLRRQNRDGR